MLVDLFFKAFLTSSFLYDMVLCFLYRKLCEALLCLCVKYITLDVIGCFIIEAFQIDLIAF